MTRRSRRYFFRKKIERMIIRELSKNIQIEIDKMIVEDLLKIAAQDTPGEWLLPRAFKKESGEHIPNGYDNYIKERE